MNSFELAETIYLSEVGGKPKRTIFVTLGTREVNIDLGGGKGVTVQIRKIVTPNGVVRVGVDKENKILVIANREIS